MSRHIRMQIPQMQKQEKRKKKEVKKDVRIGRKLKNGQKV